ncbi:MAG: hemolysin XhlA family protein [Eubacterium sp.]|nr:hemolysin XhlA family protein [Eubacterium sp.]
MSEIIVAFMALVGSGVGAIFGAFTNNALIKQKLETLEKKVEKHNNFIERIYELEKEESVLEEQMKVANHRIEDLEKEH